MNELLFGPAGIPRSVKKRTSVNGVLRSGELGLGAMELEFVHGVRMGEKSAKEVNSAREEADLVLTAHGPYYINLNAREEEKRAASRKRIYNTAKIGSICGAWSITFHPAFYLGMDKEEAFRNTKRELAKAVQEIQDEGIDLWIRPELTGKPTQLGDLQEVIRLSQEVDQVLPCIDWSHMHARTNGKWNSYEEFRKMLEMIEDGLGKEAIENMHCHVSGIEYGSKGEKNHVILEESDFKYRELMKAMKKFGCKGVVISESPNLEGDAQLLKDTYNSF